MTYYAVKVLVTAGLVVLITEIAKRSTAFGALLAAVPLTSVLAFVWLYAETGDTARIAALAQGIFWLVLPSLALFIILPALLRHGVSFWPSLGIALAVTAVLYLGMVRMLDALGIAL
ncbi:MAG TPA: DUF3147 family protein [Gammaproteobacteria bacterium]|nr:DUF3147 family protein [Gammaproteobacteria bacterium]